MLTVFGLVACQHIEPTPTLPAKPPENPIKTENLPLGIKITPYELEEIQRQNMQVIVPEQTIKQQFADGQHLPAFKQLMNNTKQAIHTGKWQQAENYALQAQRLAPQSAQSFLYLGQISNQQQKFDNAIGLAQRGLGYAQDVNIKKQLWQVILHAAQQSKNSQRIKEAQHALANL